MVRMVWGGQDAWRKHPLYYNSHKHMLTGLRPAIVIFGTYLVLESMYEAATAPPAPKPEPVPVMVRHFASRVTTASAPAGDAEEHGHAAHH